MRYVATLFFLWTGVELHWNSSHVLILKDLFCVDINIHGDRKGKICKIYWKKTFFSKYFSFYWYFYRYHYIHDFIYPNCMRFHTCTMCNSRILTWLQQKNVFLYIEIFSVDHHRSSFFLEKLRVVLHI